MGDTKSNLLEQFKCPNCGSSTLIEVVEGTVFNNVSFISENPAELTSTFFEVNDAVIGRYACGKCDFTLKRDDDYNVNTVEGLIKWIKRHP